MNTQTLNASTLYPRTTMIIMRVVNQAAAAAQKHTQLHTEYSVHTVIIKSACCPMVQIPRTFDNEASAVDGFELDNTNCIYSSPR